MKIEVNAEKVEILDKISVTDLLAVRKVKMPDMVSVELNGNILDRKLFDSTFVQDGDKVEFLYFMGGGGLPCRRPRGHLPRLIGATWQIYGF